MVKVDRNNSYGVKLTKGIKAQLQKKEKKSLVYWGKKNINNGSIGKRHSVQSMCASYQMMQYHHILP